MSLAFGSLSLTPTSVRVNGRHLCLTTREHLVLRTLVAMQASGERDLTTRQELCDAMRELYPEGPTGTDIRTLLYKLRQKLIASRAGIHIKTEVGVGYRLVKAGSA